MAGYLPAAAAERAAQYAALGLSGPEALYRDVPESVRLTAPLNLPPPQSELEVRRTLEALAEQNLRFRTILRGAGAYDHYIPAAVSRIASKEEFVTAYTPYQAEISQGVLQSIFEFQTMICELTGLGDFAGQMCETLNKTTGEIAVITDRDACIAVAGLARRELTDKRISSELEQIMEGRQIYQYQAGDKAVPVTDDGSKYLVACAAPILSEGDVLGCVLFVGTEGELASSETDYKLAQTIAGFLGRHMES